MPHMTEPSLETQLPWTAVQEDVVTLEAPTALEVSLGRRIRDGLGERKNWLELTRFVIVGFSGYVINLAVFALLVHGFDTAYILAATVSFVCAVTNNFHWNRRWTFRAHEGKAHHQAIRFLIVCFGGFLFGLLLLTIFVDGFGVAKVPAEAVATAAAAPLTFMANKLWTFAS
jgi:putative flippase GtrA